MMDSLTAAILIVSTTAAQDPSTDASASVLRNVIAEDGDDKWKVTGESIVSDDVLAIQRQIIQWTDGPDAPNLVITTGGTGFAVADGTPEVSFMIHQRIYTDIFKAIAPLLHKQAPGLVHAMLSTSLAVTPCMLPSLNLC